MRILLVIFLCLGLAGCATVNFSSKYYTPQANYKDDVAYVFNTVTQSMPLKYTYSFWITEDKQTNPPGIPQVDAKDRNNENHYRIAIPDYFVKYIYEFYYNNRYEILITIFLHEIAHIEFGIASQPPATHYLCDKSAIENLLKPHNRLYGVNEFYSMLIVMQNYWQARKGLGGHLFNIGWNVFNAATLFFYGQGTFTDWFATDIDTRINLLRRDYPGVKFVFKRSAN